MKKKICLGLSLVMVLSLMAGCGEKKAAGPAPAKGSGLMAGDILYLKFPSFDDPSIRHMKLVFSMFPGRTPVKLVMADTRKVYGTRALLHKALLEEARETLGEENVAVK